MSTKPRSLTRDLSKRLVLWLTAIWLVSVMIAGLVLRHEQGEVLDQQLIETARLLFPIVRAQHFNQVPPASVDRTSNLDIGPTQIEDLSLSYRLLQSDGTVAMRSDDTDLESAVQAPPAAGFSYARDQVLLTIGPDENGLFFQLGVAESDRSKDFQQSLVLLLAPLLLMVPLAFLAVRSAVLRASAPIKALGETIERRDGWMLDEIEQTDIPVELIPVVVNLNQLMQRLKTAMGNERAFAANSAHELRTPIAVALAQIQRLIAETTKSPVRKRAVEINAAIKRLSDLVERLLQLARADAGIGLSEHESDMRPVLKMVVEELRRRPDATGRIDLVEPLAPLSSHVDTDAFAIVVSNLLDNALKYSPENTTVQVTTVAPGVLSIVNQGDIIPAATLQTLTDRYSRVAKSGSGLGIGLSIVDALVNQAHGTLELLSPATGKDSGFEARLTLG